jgi:hypothetical protein
MISFAALWAAASLTCGTPERAIERLKVNLAQLSVRHTKDELRALLGPDISILETQNLQHAGAVTAVVAGRDGHRVADQRVECAVDGSAHVLGCKVSGAINQTQYVTEVEWQRVVTGMSVDDAYRLICRPGDPWTGSPSSDLISHDYMVLRTPPSSVSSCMARLLTRKGVIIDKEMLCE